MTEMGKPGGDGTAKKRMKVKIFDSLRESLEDVLAFERGEIGRRKARRNQRPAREEISQTR
jgi:hypothetical protein